MSNLFSIGVPSRLALALLVAGFGSAMADTIDVGPAGQIYWEQTQNFNLSGVAAPIWHYRGEPVPTPTEHVSQFATVDFLGAPAGFNIAGTEYSLTGVSISLNYALMSTWVTYCHGIDSGRHCQADGYFSTSVNASFATLSTTASSAESHWSGHAYDDGWELFGLIPYPVHPNGSEHKTVTLNRSDTTAYDSDLAFFESRNPLALQLEKNTYLTFTYAYGFDNDDYVAESANVWSGTAALKYTFSPVAPVVPEPSMFFLMGIGLVGLGMLKRKRD